MGCEHQLANGVRCAAATIRPLEDGRGRLYPTWCAAMPAEPALAANALAVVSATYEDNSEEPIGSRNGGGGGGGGERVGA